MRRTTTRRGFCLLAWMIAAPASGQGEPVELPPLTLDSTVGIAAGLSAEVVGVGGEALEFADPGVGVEAFLGVRWAIIDELRLGAAISTHSDSLTGERMTVRGLFGSVYWGILVGSVRIRAGPRVLWTDVAGHELRRLRGLGFGVTAGVLVPISELLELELEGAWTLTSYSRPVGSGDPDGMASGTLGAVGIGLLYTISRRDP